MGRFDSLEKVASRLGSGAANPDDETIAEAVSLAEHPHLLIILMRPGCKASQRPGCEYGREGLQRRRARDHGLHELDDRP